MWAIRSSVYHSVLFLYMTNSIPDLTTDAFQVILGSVLGDGHISKKCEFSTGSKHKEYLLLKQEYLKTLCSDNWYRAVKDNPFRGTSSEKKYPYHTLRISKCPESIAIQRMSLEDRLANLSELGLAIWLYDDVSLHQRKHFYNLSTHSFSLEEHERYLVPFFLSKGMFPRITIERKKNGASYYYLRFNKSDGNVREINRLLGLLPVKCYGYKRLPENFVSGAYYTLGDEQFDSLVAIAKQYNVSIHRVRMSVMKGEELILGKGAVKKHNGR